MSDAPHGEISTVAPDKADPTAGTTFFIGGVSILLLIAIVLALQTLYYRTSEAEHFRKVVSEHPQELRQVQTEQLEQIAVYRWINESEGVVAIPIDKAMELTVREQGAR